MLNSSFKMKHIKLPPLYYIIILKGLNIFVRVFPYSIVSIHVVSFLLDLTFNTTFSNTAELFMSSRTATKDFLGDT